MRGEGNFSHLQTGLCLTVWRGVVCNGLPDLESLLSHKMPCSTSSEPLPVISFLRREGEAWDQITEPWESASLADGLRLSLFDQIGLAVTDQLG